MGKFKLDKKDLKALDEFLDEFFGDTEEAKEKRNRDNFMLEEDRDHFIFKEGFEAGCIWMLRRFSSKFITDVFGKGIDKKRNRSLDPSIVDIPEIPDNGSVYNKEESNE